MQGHVFDPSFAMQWRRLRGGSNLMDFLQQLIFGKPKDVLNEFTKLLEQGLETQNIKLKVHFEICSELTLKLKTNVSSNSQTPSSHAKKAALFEDIV